MRLTIFVISFLAIGNGFAQTDSLKQTKIKIGLLYQPTYSFRTLSGDSIASQYVNSRKWYDRAKLGYEAGIQMEGCLNQNLSIRSGLIYSNRGYKVYNRWWDEWGIASLGYADINYQFHYLSVPLLAVYNLNFENFRFKSSAGISLDYLINHRLKVDIEYDEWYSMENETIFLNREDEHHQWWGPAPGTLNTSNIYLSLCAALGLEVDLTDRLSFELSAKANYSVTSVFSEAIEERLYNLGVNVGLNFSL